MKIVAGAIRTSVLAISLLLAACGGGGSGDGVNSTPNPDPTPTPTTGANDDLIAPLVSESFANNATVASGTFPAPSNAAANPSTLTISYNQAAQSYTIQVQGRSQTFGQGDRDAAQSTAEVTTFKKVSGATTDLLTLTNPGSSGPYRYTYVGGGFWQRAVQSGNTIAGTFDSFAYGIATPSASVPKTGGAAYDFDVLGVLGRSSGAAPYGVGGAGRMTVDFGAARFSANGSVNLVDSLSGQTFQSNIPITANGSLASGNGFSGSFVFDPLGGVPYAGGIDGRFYGPAAEEMGAAVYGVSQNPAFPGTVSAALIGRKGTAGSGTNLSLVSLFADQTFYARGAHHNAFVDAADNKLYRFNVDEPNQFGGFINPEITYTASSRIYSIVDRWAGDDVTGSYLVSESFGPAQLAVSQPDQRFIEYRKANGADGSVLRLYKTGNGNPELALTYASFGIWDITKTPGGDGYNQTRRLYFTYGITSTGIPRTGTANYTGLINGNAGSSAAGATSFDVSGGFNFTFDFAADTVSGTLSPVGKNTLTGVQSSLGVYSLANTRGPFAAGQGFDGYLVLAGAAGPTGAFKGQFFGPNVAEIGGTFTIKEADTANPGQNFSMSGAFVGKKN